MQDAFIKANQHFTNLVNGIIAEQWEQTVPATPDWTVKRLVGHVTENNVAFCKALNGDSELLATVDNQPAAWNEAAENAEISVRGLVDLTREVASPMGGKVPIEELLKMEVVDHSLHAFDLAQAIGADTTLDPELVKVAYETIAPNADKMRDAGVFGPEVTVNDDASPQDKLLGLSGRQPV